jgi:hypothetical protein
MTTTMIEVVIERSANAEGETTYRWSIWNDDEQIETGRTTHFSAADCEAKAVEHCRANLGFRPDKITRR